MSTQPATNATQLGRIYLISCRDGTWTIVHEPIKNRASSPHRADLENAASLLGQEPPSHVRLFSIDCQLEEKRYIELCETVKDFNVHELRFGHRSGLADVPVNTIHNFILSFPRLQRLAFYPPLRREHLSDEFLELCAQKGVITLALPDEPPEDGGLYDITENGVLSYCFGLPQTESRWIRVDNFHVTGGFFGKLLKAYRNSENTAEVAMRISSATAIISMDRLKEYAPYRRHGVSSTKLYFEFTGELHLQVAMTMCRTIMWVQRGKNPTVFQTRVLSQATNGEINGATSGTSAQTVHAPIRKRTTRSQLPNETFMHVYANLNGFDLDAVAISNRQHWANLSKSSKYLPLRRIKTLKLAAKTVITAANERELTVTFDLTKPTAALRMFFNAARNCYVREFLLALVCFPAVVDKLAKGLRETVVDELRITNFSSIHCVSAKSLHRFILSFPSIRAVCSTAQRLRHAHISNVFLQKCSEKGISTLELECHRPIRTGQQPENDGDGAFPVNGKALLDFAFGGSGKTKRVFRMNNLHLSAPTFFEDLVQKHIDSDYEGDIVMVIKADAPLVDRATVEKYEALGNLKEGENNFTVFDFMREDRRLQIAMPTSGKVLLASRTAKINGHPFFF
ncbi:hypothetical protein AAVH_14507 [Aphelenchoides avenae]|nr:hypothetical protein AAVH_14507 [Aphelenchus avenae]